MGMKIQVKLQCDAPGCGRRGTVEVGMESVGEDGVVDGWQMLFFSFGPKSIVIRCASHPTTRDEIFRARMEPA